MSNLRSVEIVVRCEDAAHERFARDALRTLKFKLQRVRIWMCPPGKQDAAGWVLNGYCRAVKEVRKRRNMGQRAALIAIIDADNETVDKRVRELESKKKRHKDDRVAHWIPKRCIETWILNLGANESIPENDEENRNGLKNRLERIERERPTVRKQAAAAFIKFIHNQCPEGEYSHLPALHAARAETRVRLLPQT